MKTKKIDYQFSFRIETDLKIKTAFKDDCQTLHMGRYAVQLSKDEGKAIFDSFPERIKSEIKVSIEQDYRKEQSRINRERKWEPVDINEIKSNKKNPETGYIYLIKSQKAYKIGRAKRPVERFKKYVTENPHKVKLLLSRKVHDYVNVEIKLHNMFKNKWLRGEWFNLNNQDVNKIKNYLEATI